MAVEVVLAIFRTGPARAEVDRVNRRVKVRARQEHKGSLTRHGGSPFRFYQLIIIVSFRT